MTTREFNFTGLSDDALADRWNYLYERRWEAHRLETVILDEMHSVRWERLHRKFGRDPADCICGDSLWKHMDHDEQSDEELSFCHGNCPCPAYETDGA